MSANNYKKLMLSELSFIILNNDPDSHYVKEADTELRRRFKYNGCDYDMFLKYEQSAILKRGKDIGNYLIYKNTDAQKLFELYFKSCINNSLIHYEILFSETHLLNEIGKNQFFDKVLNLEINNLGNRIKNNDKELEKLNQVKKFLLDIKKKLVRNVWLENTATDFVFDITPSLYKIYGYWSRKLNDTNEKELKYKFYNLMFNFFYNIGETDLGLYAAIHYFIFKDSIKISSQKRKIIKQLKNGYVIDYSFFNEEINAKKQIKKLG